MPGINIGARDTVVIKKRERETETKIPALMELTF